MKIKNGTKTLTWNYIVEQMKEKYGIRIEYEEQLDLLEIEAYIEKIFNDYYKEN